MKYREFVGLLNEYCDLWRDFFAISSIKSDSSCNSSSQIYPHFVKTNAWGGFFGDNKYLGGVLCFVMSVGESPVVYILIGLSVVLVVQLDVQLRHTNTPEDHLEDSKQQK